MTKYIPEDKLVDRLFRMRKKRSYIARVQCGLLYKRIVPLAKQGLSNHAISLRLKAPKNQIREIIRHRTEKSSTPDIDPTQRRLGYLTAAEQERMVSMLKDGRPPNGDLDGLLGVPPGSCRNHYLLLVRTGILEKYRPGQSRALRVAQRKRDVISRALQGWTNTDIAADLGLDRHEVAVVIMNATKEGVAIPRRLSKAILVGKDKEKRHFTRDGLREYIAQKRACGWDDVKIRAHLNLNYCRYWLICAS